MTELEKFAGAVLLQWRGEGGGDGDPIAVSVLLDRVMPYRVARRLLGIDVSEDYEALILGLLAEDEGLARVEPADAAELAKTAHSAKLPDLGVLQLLRSASLVLHDRVAEFVGAAPVVLDRKPVRSPAPGPTLVLDKSTPVAAVVSCWHCHEALPVGRDVKFCPFCGVDQRQPVCKACGAVAEHGWKHCAECGASL